MGFEQGDAEKVRWVASHMSVTGTLRQSAIHMRRIADIIEAHSEEEQTIVLPKQFFNIEIGTYEGQECLIGDSNDSAHWVTTRVLLDGTGWRIISKDALLIKISRKRTQDD